MEMKINCNFIDFNARSGVTNGNEDFSFITEDLIRSAITVGKKSWEQVYITPYFSEREVLFRIEMIYAFLVMSKSDDYLRKSENFYTMDPSEKGAINYFLGMIFSHLMSCWKFNVVWLVHLDSFDKSKIERNTKSRMKPDFIGITKENKKIVVEAKGWTDKKQERVEKAKQQLNAVLSVNNEKDILKIASVFYEKNKSLFLDIVDPEDKGLLEISSEKSDYLLDYYSRVYMLIKRNGNSKETINGCEFITCKISCETIKVGLLKSVYERIDKYNDEYERKHRNKEYKKNISKDINRDLSASVFENQHSILEISKIEISKTREISIGLDGIFVKSLDSTFEINTDHRKKE